MNEAWSASRFDPTLEASGRRLYWIENTVTESSLWMEHREAQQRQCLSAPEEWVHGYQLSPQDDGLIYLFSDASGQVRICFLAPGRKEVLPIEDPRLGGWIAPSSFLFSAPDEHGHHQIFQLQLDSMGITRQTAAAQHHFVMATHPGTGMAIWLIQDHTQCALWRVQDQQKMLLTCEAEQFGSLRFDPHTQRIFALSTQSPHPYQGIYVFEHAWAPYLLEDADIDDYAVWHERCLYMVNDHGCSRLKCREEDQVLTLEAPTGIYSQFCWAAEGESLCLTYSLPQTTSAVDTFTWNEIRNNTWSARLKRERELPDPELLKFTAADGVVSSGWFFPSGTSSCVVLLHGGPKAQFKPHHHPTVTCFLEQGWSVLALNYRGSSGSGEAYSRLGEGQNRLDVLLDIEAACQSIIQHRLADASKLGLCGWSYGAFLAMLALTRAAQKWHHAILLSGFYDLMDHLKSLDAPQRAWRELEYGALSEDNSSWMRPLSFRNHVNRINCPLLVMHGVVDEVVPFELAQTFVHAVSETNPRVSFHRMEAGHNLIEGEDPEAFFRHITDFLQSICHNAQGTCHG